MTNTTNRIDGLLTETLSSGPAARTEAQQAASRINGRKSGGPITLAGKFKSSLNSWKHGLLARVVIPPTDAREHGRLYLNIHRELTEELRPSNFTQHAAVDVLAKDYVQLARAGAMIEALQRPAVREDDELGKRWDKVVEARAELKQLAAVQAALKAGEPLCCRPRTAELVAGRVVAYVEQVRADLFPPDEDAVPDDELSDFERDEVLQLKRRWAAVRPPREQTPDTAILAAVLRGDRHAARATLTWLGRAVGVLAEAHRAWLQGQKDVEKEVARREVNALAATANAPEQLILLQRYERAIQRSIDQRLKRFSRAL